jgi:cyanophycin synthetase
VLVERFVRGDEHRLLVVGKRMVAATQRRNGHGSPAMAARRSPSCSTAQVNTDPRRGPEQDLPLETCCCPSATPNSLRTASGRVMPRTVCRRGARIVVQRNGNMSFDVTDDVHPETARLVTLAARVVGLDIAGIDLVAEDIRRPLREQGGAIVEVNAGPGLLMHLKPAVGRSRAGRPAIVDHLFARRRRAHSGGRHQRQPGQDAVAKLVAHLTRLSRHACRAGLQRRSVSGQRRLEDGRCRPASNRRSAC